MAATCENVVEASRYRRLRPTFVVDARGEITEPRNLHLAKYSTNHNYRELGGHRFWEHDYRLREGNPVFYGPVHVAKY